MTFRSRFVSILVACAAVLATASLFGCGGQAPSETTAAAGTPAAEAKAEIAGYKVGSGDKLHIAVFGQEQLTGDFDVDGKGDISYPLIGTVPVGGMTASQIADALTNRLSPNYLKNPKVTVEVIKYRPFYVLGQVRKPGSYPYVDGMSVLQAVAIAGGFTLRGDQSGVLIARASDPQHKEQHVSVDAPVYPGDVIRVPVIFF
ncbi:MAG TPA: polysaccharide biosynthesis/export family protein [Alphaproteobacteria bacterium]|nr:polysaccharide biosynthesis/export family protein [Alphaproteobacteria bacterium]